MDAEKYDPSQNIKNLLQLLQSALSWFKPEMASNGRGTKQLMWGFFVIAWVEQ